MWQELEERTLSCAEYIVQTGCTVRACSAHFSVSKSTVHKDMTERLPLMDKTLYAKVRKILDKNLSERHIRGGDATKKKYRLRREKEANEAKRRAAFGTSEGNDTLKCERKGGNENCFLSECAATFAAEDGEYLTKKRLKRK